VRLVPPAEIEKFAFVKSGFALKVLVDVITKVGFTCPAVIVDVDEITGEVADAGVAAITDRPVPNKMAAVAIEMNFLNMM
jgi:hypothetical protein